HEQMVVGVSNTEKSKSHTVHRQGELSLRFDETIAATARDCHVDTQPAPFSIFWSQQTLIITSAPIVTFLICSDRNNLVSGVTGASGHNTKNHIFCANA
ncbi:MAG: hypothetical protein CMM54_11190, partial [Rhodospirillaceae bacterium]|nr:hypothetical protein [Rhodospirillaceae bacterium]